MLQSFTIFELKGCFLSSSTIVEYLVRIRWGNSWIKRDRWFGTLVSMLGPRGVLPEVPSAHESPNQVGMVRADSYFTTTDRMDENKCFPYTFQKLQQSNRFEEELTRKIPMFFWFWWTIYITSRNVGDPAVTAFKMDQNAAWEYVGSRLGSVKCR